jgi:acyl-CoA synthetase (AMP-forming)/AMP-acid ligase II
VILKQGCESDADAMRQRAREQLSAYKVPRHFFFYADGELPFTDSGKIDKRTLTELLTLRIESESSGGTARG